jgi:hypothetical protein
MARVLGKPSSLLARMMFFAKVCPGQGQGRGVGGRARGSYVDTLCTDLRYLYSGTVDPGSGSLDYLGGLAEAKGGPRNVKQVLSELRPDEDYSRHEELPCTPALHTQRFADSNSLRYYIVNRYCDMRQWRF